MLILVNVFKNFKIDKIAIDNLKFKPIIMTLVTLTNKTRYGMPYA